MRLKKILKALLNPNSTKKAIVQTEEQYYQELFTKNPLWSTENANDEEQKRWNVVKNFIEYSKASISDSDKENFKILDAGCGRGWLSNLMSQYGQVTGIEPVAPVIQHAKKLFPHLDLRAGYAEDLLKEGMAEKFDLVISSEVIEHVPDSEKVDFVTTLLTLLKPGGFLIITTPRGEALEEWTSYSEPGQPIEEWISEPALEKLVTGLGATVEKIERFGIMPRENAPEVLVYQLWLFKK